MRLPALVLLLVTGVLGSSGALRAQETFTDADFDFTMTLPKLLHQVSDAERAVIMNVTEEQARNVPRDEAAPGTRLTHRYIWVDRSSPYNRQMDVTLYDGPPPYLKEADLVKAYTDSGLTVEGTEQVKAPVGGLRVEGTFTNSQGVLMRKTVVYVPDRSKWALVNLQSFAADWAIVQPEFLQSVLSIRLQRQAPPPGAGAGPGPGGGMPGRGKPGARGPGGAAVSAAPIDWTSLPITGSLVLSALLLAHLLLGGRGAR